MIPASDSHKETCNLSDGKFLRGHGIHGVSEYNEFEVLQCGRGAQLELNININMKVDKSNRSLNQIFTYQIINSKIRSRQRFFHP